jgi:hypothetical protein
MVSSKYSRIVVIKTVDDVTVLNVKREIALKDSARSLPERYQLSDKIKGTYTASLVDYMWLS